MGRANVTDATTREERREKRKREREREEAGILSLSSFLLPSLAAPFFLVAVIPRVSRTSLPGSACEVGRARDREGRSSSLEKGKREDESKAYSMSERAKEREGERGDPLVGFVLSLLPSSSPSSPAAAAVAASAYLLACSLLLHHALFQLSSLSRFLSGYIVEREREREQEAFSGSPE